MPKLNFFCIAINFLCFSSGNLYGLENVHWGKDKYSRSELIKLGESFFMKYDQYSQQNIYRYFKGLGVTNYPRFWDRTNGSSKWINSLKSLGYTSNDSKRRYYYGCKYDFASIRLKELIAKFGDKHPYVKIWVDNQLAVFSNCESYFQSTPTFPSVDSGSMKNINHDINGDLEYQTASAHYYSRNYTDALKIYNVLTAHNTSRYRAVATYMSALIKARTMDADVEQLVDNIISDSSLQEVHRISKQLIHVEAYGTKKISLLKKQLTNIDMMLERKLSELESNQEFENDYRQSIRDIDWFFINNRYERLQLDDDWWLTNATSKYSYANAVSEVAKSSEQIDWIQTNYSWGRFDRDLPWLGLHSNRITRPSATTITNHALRRWKNDGGRHWLVAAISRIHPSHPEANNIIKLLYDIKKKFMSDNATDSDYVIYPILLYHSIRLLLAKGMFDQAIELLTGEYRGSDIFRIKIATEALRWLIGNGNLVEAKRLESNIHYWPDAYIHHSQTIALRQILAENLEDFMKHNRIQPQNAYGLHLGTLSVLNLLPVRQLNNVLNMAFVPGKDKAAISRAAWMRAYLLNMEELLKELTPKLVDFNPYLKDYIEKQNNLSFKKYKNNYIIYMLLKHPRFTIYVNGKYFGRFRPYYLDKNIDKALQIDVFNHNDNNWWCGFRRDKAWNDVENFFYNYAVALPNYDANYGFRRYKSYLEESLEKYQIIRNKVLSENKILSLIDWEELKELEKVPQAPEFLSTKVINWHKNRKTIDKLFEDKHLLPEALSLAVKTTRYGCNRDGKHGRYSRRAFEILHYNYLSSSFTKKTPYWFN